MKARFVGWGLYDRERERRVLKSGVTLEIKKKNFNNRRSGKLRLSTAVTLKYCCSAYIDFDTIFTFYFSCIRDA